MKNCSAFSILVNENWEKKRSKLTLSWISSRVDSVTERVALKIKLTIVEYRTHRYPFTRRRDMASCPWTKQSHLGKWSSGKLRTSALVNDETLRSIADSALNKEKLILLKYLISLRFICCCLLPYFLIWKSLAVEVYISRKLQDYENIHGRDSFLIT